MLKRGLLSHVRASKVSHASIADASVQDRRVGKRTPGGRPLHDYVNLYFNARNAMLNKRARGSGAGGLCVLRVELAVIDLPGVYVTDRNAASWPEYDVGAAGLAMLDKEVVYAESWNHRDPFEKAAHKKRMMAEVLVPDRVGSEYIIGAYVANDAAAAELKKLTADLPVTKTSYMFFDMN